MSDATRATLLRTLWQRFRWPAILLLGYLIAEQLFVWAAGDDGLFFPAVSGKGLAVVALGLGVLALRLVVYGLLAGVVTYQAVLLVWDTARPRRAPPR